MAMYNLSRDSSKRVWYLSTYFSVSCLNPTLLFLILPLTKLVDNIYVDVHTLPIHDCSFVQLRHPEVSWQN